MTVDPLLLLDDTVRDKILILETRSGDALNLLEKLLEKLKDDKERDLSSSLAPSSTSSVAKDQSYSTSSSSLLKDKTIPCCIPYQLITKYYKANVDFWLDTIDDQEISSEAEAEEERLKDEAEKERILMGRVKKSGVVVKKSGSNGIVKKPVVGRRRMGGAF